MKTLFVTLIKLFMVLLLISFFVIYFGLRASLPTLDGDIDANTEFQVSITRDHEGTPTIFAKHRSDASFALGYLHGQERFFQMDLLRRNSAGELSELFGAIALPHDKKVRAHQFRQRANRFIKQLSPRQTAALKAYTNGVNQGIGDLGAKPFEYWLLNKAPAAWQESDSMLVLYSMYMDLQYEYGDRELTLGQLQNNLMPDVYDFLTPAGSNWDAALDDTEYRPSPLPTNTFDLAPVLKTLAKQPTWSPFNHQHEALVGSNNWAVGGAISDTGSAIVADDMHLGISVPNIWYRASLRFEEAGDKQTLDGLTLPGVPALVAGSTGKIAWGFTNSYGDWNDLVRLKLSDDGKQYLTVDGYRPFDISTEVVLVSGQQAETVEVRNTIWGPVVGKDYAGNLLAMRWVAHDSNGINFNLLDLELANNVAEAVEIAHTAGIPAQNIVLGDRQGNIAWTIAGAIPSKFGASNSDNSGFSVPQDWSRGDIGWNGYLASAEYPKIVNPEHHRIWTANSRVVGNQMLEKIGNGGYALGARSQQIRDLMFTKTKFDEQALLDIHNDDRALFLKPWHEFLLQQVLTHDFVQSEGLSELVIQLQNWQGRAAIDSVGYLFVREFRLNVRRALFAPMTDQLNATSSGDEFSLGPIRHQLEIPMWQMITQQPQHLLPKQFRSWTVMMQTLVNQTVSELTEKYGSLEQATWGARNTSRIQHPLSKAIPAVGWLLDMPAQAINGDSYMPRVQGPAFGASQRFSISPGHEDRAILHMPSSQSGHPLSPYYGVGHEAWVKGVATPLLPGPSKYRLTLLPQ